MKVRVVLVEPAHPGNVGGAARAMKTMGLSDLVLVKPARFPDPVADWRAAGALDVIEDARVCESVNEAIAECGYVAGTSARDRHIPWPVQSIRDFAAEIAGGKGGGKPVAILFGRETSGLTNDELAKCHVHVRIPANNDYGSLNLAMSVQVVAYELFQAHLSEVEEPKRDRELASATEVEALHQHLARVIEEVEFFAEDSPRQALNRLRRMFARIELDETEVQILRGFLSKVERRIRQGSGPHSAEP